MNRPVRLVARLAALGAMLPVLQLLAAPRPAVTPYPSALSSLGPSPAIAAPGCNTKYCSKEPGRKSPTCIQAPVDYNCSASGGTCTITPC